VLGSGVAGAVPVESGYTTNERLLVDLEDGRRAFVKIAIDADSSAWLRTEHWMYAELEGSFMPRLLAWDDSAEFPLLAIEDLRDAHWPPPWSPEQIDAVLAALDELARTPPPDGLASLETAELAGRLLTGWDEIAGDPEPFLSVGLVSRAWLDEALPQLQAATASAPVAGEQLLHLDVRSDNICIRGDRALLVDWNWACVGNALLDLAGWLPSLHLEGGPPPHEVSEEAGAFAPVLAGFWGARAGLPPPPTAASVVRELQRAQLAIALPWAARTLGLPPPDGPEVR
jgi:hypothetical protein